MKKINLLILLTFTFFINNSAWAEQNSEPLKLYIFYSNDLQAGIGKQEATFMNPNFPPVLGGGAATANIITSYRQKAQKDGDIVLLLDGGDIFKGAPPLGDKSEGLAIVDYMNEVGYDAMVPGNRDFDLGKEAFVRMAERASFHVLAANLTDSATSAPPPSVKPYAIIEKGGIKIGILGIVSQSAEQNDDPQNVAGLDFKAEAPAAQQAIAGLKAQNVNFIIALAHLGLPYDAEEGYEEIKEQDNQNIYKKSYMNAMELAHYVKGIDILISGQIHRGYQQPWEDPVNHTLCFQNYANGGNLGMVTIEIDRESKTIAGYKLPSEDGGLLLLSEDEFWPDEKFDNSIKKMQEKYEQGYGEVIGITENTLTRNSRGESPMGNMMCDAMIEAGGADFAFNNFNSMRFDLNIGAVTPRDVVKVFPHGNSIVVINLKGALLLKLLESSVKGNYAGLAIGGGRLVYEKDRPDEQKIISLTIKGQPVDTAKTYHVATSAYLAEGNYGMNKLADLPAECFNNTGILVREAVIEYIKKHTPLKIENDGRWIKK